LANGFTTTSPNICEGTLVISQVYGGGGNAGATYRNDFVELHNRGTTAIDVSTYSIQYAATGGSTWSKQNLTGSIPAGGYYLVQLFSAAAVGAVLPTPDVSGTIDMAGANGKVALVSNQTAIGAISCPTAGILDFVGYGTANCFEGSAAAPALSATAAGARAQAGCADVNNNGADFTALTPLARNSMTAPFVCQCLVRNESNLAGEVDYCTVQFPTSLNLAAGAASGNVFGRIYEATVTDVGGLGGPANPNIRAQLGWGLPTANPQYQSWNWFNATFNAGFMDASNDEYQASFTAPTSGSYRYVYRFSIDSGLTWTVCDRGVDTGAGSNVGLSFEFADMPIMTVP
jgi:hypothetical protein